MNGSQLSAPRINGEASKARSASMIRPVISGIANRAMAAGSANHRSRTVALIHGVAIEIKIRPPTIGAQAILAQVTARACSSPSVFMINQVAPISA